MSDLGNKKILARNLKYYMDKHEIDRNDICNILNIPYTTVSDWLNAKKYPRIDRIELLADYFNIQKSDLIEDKTKKNYIDKLEKLYSENKDKITEEDKEKTRKILEKWINLLDNHVDSE